MVFDEDIDEFFSDKAKKKEDCDSYALEHFGGPVRTVSPQGCYSYTVTAARGGTVVQFRDNTTRLPNMVSSELISNTHPELVAIPTFKGIFGPESSSGLSVYYMNALPGLNYFNMYNTISDSLQMQMTFAESLARYMRHHKVAPFSDDRTKKVFCAGLVETRSRGRDA